VSEAVRQTVPSTHSADAFPPRYSAARRPAPFADVQAALGNATVQRRLLQRVVQRQALEVAPPEDEHEREAERLADKLSEGIAPPRIPTAAPEAVRRAAVEDEKRKAESPKAAPKAESPKPPPKAEATTATEPKKKDEPAIATKAEPGGTPQVTPAVTDGIAAGGGRSLPGDARGQFEAQLGSDLADVRIHDDASAAAAASDLDARAFTFGRDVFFGAGRYQPHTAEGRKLLAHELVHTVQQRPGGSLSRAAIQRQTDPPPPSAPGSDETMPIRPRSSSRSEKRW